MDTMTAEKPMLRSVTAGGLHFDFPGYGNDGREITVHTKGVDGLPLLLSIVLNYDGDELYGKASHFLSEVHGPKDLIPILSFTAAQGRDLQQVADQVAGIRFERVRHLGTDWLISSTGHAAAMDAQREMITISPGSDDGTWRWERECQALDEFNRASSSFYGLRGDHCSNREAAMIQALAAKEKLRSASAALALAVGLTVIS